MFLYTTHISYTHTATASRSKHQYIHGCVVQVDYLAGSYIIVLCAIPEPDRQTADIKKSQIYNNE